MVAPRKHPEELRVVDQRADGVELLFSDGASMLHARWRDGGLMPFSSLGDGLNSAMTYLLAPRPAGVAWC